MPHHIDPTYLRYVYDGLIQGQISADNAADLPHGLVGLYEELFPASMPVAERQHLLERFCIWALMRREVSTAFMAGLWQQSEEEVMDFIRNNSRWFVSPKQWTFQIQVSTSRLIDALENVTKNLKQQNHKLEKIHGQAVANNLHTAVNTYQLYQIGQNAKSLWS